MKYKPNTTITKEDNHVMAFWKHKLTVHIMTRTEMEKKLGY